jgi:exopolysaccharide production protein ExoY
MLEPGQIALVDRKVGDDPAKTAEEVSARSGAIAGTLGPVGGSAKRGADIVLASIALAVLSPVLIGLAIAVRATSRGPALFRHPRVGWNGRSFMCLKFRSMVMDADAVLETLLASDPAAAEEWASTHKLKSDPRVTAVGRVLRRFSLDELPQLLNVLRGEMSLVGPRPVVDGELPRFGEAAAFYLAARPGITGPWQISGRNDVAYENRVRIDQAYVENWSLVRDLVILIRTVPAVLLARGSY